MRPIRNLLCLACSLSFTYACKKTNLEDTSSMTGSIRTAGSVTSVDELRISTLRIDLPDAIEQKKSSTKARLLASKKSADACLIGSKVTETVERLRSIANFACHIEAEKGRIEFNKKYKLMMPDGSAFAHLLVEKDNDKVSFGFCKIAFGSSREQITIDSVSSFGPKGQLRAFGEYEMDAMPGEEELQLMQNPPVVPKLSWAAASNFDLTQEASQTIEAQSKFTLNSNDDYSTSVNLILSKDSVSIIKQASKGKNEGSEFSEQGIAKFSAKNGASLFKNSLSRDASPLAYTRVDYFDTEGFTVSKTSSTDFAAILAVSDNELPAVLASSFSPEKPSGWVSEGCPNPDNEVVIEMGSAGHAACENQVETEYKDCFAEEFESGEDYIDTDPIEVLDPQATLPGEDEEGGGLAP